MKAGPGSPAAVKLLAGQEGLLLDPVYTGKAMAGLLDGIGRHSAASGTFVGGRRPVYPSAAAIALLPLRPSPSASERRFPRWRSGSDEQSLPWLHWPVIMVRLARAK